MYLLTADKMITLSVSDLLFSVLWLAIILVVFMIAGILFKVFQTVKDVRAIVADNRQNINAVLNEAPQITKNIQEVTTEVSHATQSFRGTVDNIAETTQDVTATIKDNNPVNEAIVSVYKAINNVRKLLESVQKKTPDKEEKKDTPSE